MKVFTTGQVAKICKVAPRTVSKWFDSGRLKGYRIPGSQDRRIPREYLIKFLKEHGIRVVRRDTGGGAVYHDLGNLNYSFITDAGDTESDNTITYEKVDFRAVVLAWKEKVREDPADAAKDIEFDEAAKLVIEVSWPEEMPYAARQKRYFSYEIAKPGAFVLEP